MNYILIIENQKATIESLRQQLADMTADRDMWARSFKNGGTETMQKQLSDHIKREVMLRDVLGVVVDRPKSHEAVRVATQALAATADLDGLILCEKKPVARKISYGSLVFLEGYAELSEWTQLYRALEPK